MKLKAALLMLAWVGGAQNIEIYRAKNRLAQELIPIVEAVLRDEGQVTLDPRTGTLVLSGSPGAIQRALALLEQVDQPLRQVVLTHELREFAEVEAARLQVRWQATLGDMRIGTLPLPADGIHMALGARREATNARSRSVLRVLEGGSGVIATGEAFPFVYRPYWGARATEFIPAETGFEASVQVLPDGRVYLELRPFSGHLDERGALRYTSAATTVMAKPGETIVIGETSLDSEGTSVALDGAARTRVQTEQVLLISVEIEEP